MARRKREDPVGAEWTIVISPFGYPMYPYGDGCGWTDRLAEAFRYDQRDNRQLKAAFFSGVAKLWFEKDVAVSFLELPAPGAH